MKVEYSSQYSKPCIVVDGTERAADVIALATDEGATYMEYPGEICFVVEFYPERFPELYTAEALTRSLPQ